MRAYPSTRERILRARERGIRAAHARQYENPYSDDCSGRPLWDAWDFGNCMVVYAVDDMSIYEPTSFGAIDLSVEFAEWHDDLERELPLIWPRGMGAA